GNRSRRRRRKHRLSDRQRAVCKPQGRALSRHAAEAASTAAARPRPLLVAHEGAHPRQDGRVPPRPDAEHARHPDQVEPARTRPCSVPLSAHPPRSRASPPTPSPASHRPSPPPPHPLTHSPPPTPHPPPPFAAPPHPPPHHTPPPRTHTNPPHQPPYPPHYPP